MTVSPSGSSIRPPRVDWALASSALTSFRRRRKGAYSACMQTPNTSAAVERIAGRCSAGVVYMRRCPRDALCRAVWECSRFGRRTEGCAVEASEGGSRAAKPAVGEERLSSAARLVGGRLDGRRRSVKRFRLIAAGRGSDAHRRVERVEAYGGPSGSAQRSPIKIGALVPLTAHFPPGASRRARRWPCGERDQQVGRREGARAGRLLNLVVADDQSRTRTRPSTASGG
jgi:hypothetical protein